MSTVTSTGVSGGSGKHRVRFLLSSRVGRPDNITHHATRDAAPPHSASPRIAERGSVGVAARPRTRPPSMPDQIPAYDMVADLVNLIQMAPHLRLHCTTPTSTRHRGTARHRAPPRAARTRARSRQPALNPTTRPAPQSSSNGCSRLHETSPAEDLRTRTRTRPGHA